MVSRKNTKNNIFLYNDSNVFISAKQAKGIKRSLCRNGKWTFVHKEQYISLLLCRACLHSFSSTANLRESYGSQVYQGMQPSRETLQIWQDATDIYEGSEPWENAVGAQEVGDGRQRLLPPPPLFSCTPDRGLETNRGVGGGYGSGLHVGSHMPN